MYPVLCSSFTQIFRLLLLYSYIETTRILLLFQSQAKHHYTLGNVYAVLGDYNKSSICYENALTLLPTFEAAVDRWHAVLCHRKLEKALENQHKSLQRTLEDLKEYQKRHEEWQQQNDKLISEQVVWMIVEQIGKGDM